MAQAQAGTQGTPPIMVVERVSKDFGGLRALNNVSLSMNSGRVYGLVGPNGAGKTTLFNVLTGFLKPDAGTISYKETDITRWPAYRVVRLGIARTFQNVRVFPKMSALEHVVVAFQNQVGESAVGGMMRRWGRPDRANVERAMGVLESVGLDAKAREAAENLSYPEQKLLILARVVATGAEFLLIDEPTSGLDTRSFKGMLGFLRNLVDRQGKTVCVVEHNLDLIRGICDWTYFLNQGELIAAGTCDDLLQRKDLAKIYFGRETGR
jgi:branched-chain amino acid transport system permease protein